MEKNVVRVGARSQDKKNRQNSIDNLSEEVKTWFKKAQMENIQHSHDLYKKAIDKGIAKECARVFLPEGQTPSRMYMNGTIRSWIHYIDLRCGNGTQLEHREVAEQAKRVFCEQVPVIGKAMNWE